MTMRVSDEYAFSVRQQRARATKSLFPLPQITKSITNRGEAGSTPGAPRPTAGSTAAGPSGTQQPAVRPPAATRSTITRSTGTITAKTIGNRRRRVGRRAGRTTRPCGTTTTETHTFTMIVTRTPPAPARGKNIRMMGHGPHGVILYHETF